MNRILALFAFIIFAIFLGILAFGVPSPDLSHRAGPDHRARRLGLRYVVPRQHDNRDATE